MHSAYYLLFVQSLIDEVFNQSFFIKKATFLFFFKIVLPLWNLKNPCLLQEFIFKLCMEVQRFSYTLLFRKFTFE